MVAKRAGDEKERVMGFEPTAQCLGSTCATTALHPHMLGL